MSDERDKLSLSDELDNDDDVEAHVLGDESNKLGDDADREKLGDDGERGKLY